MIRYWELDPSRPFVLCLDSGAVQELKESTPALKKESHEELQLKVPCQAKESAGEKESGTKKVGTLNSVGFLYLIRVTRLPDCQIAISSGPQAQSHACKAGWPCIGDVLVTILNLCALVRVSGRRMSRRRMRAADKAAIEPAWTSMGYSECSNNHFDISEQICLL